MTLNKATLIGRLGRDPEVRRLNDGSPVVNLRIATSEYWKDKNSGERKERTEWHTVVIFNENLAKVAEEYLKKGSQVYVEGMIQTRKWQDQSGQDRYSTEIVLQKFGGALRLLGSKGDNGDIDESEPRSSGNKRTGTQPAQRYEDLDDDIPF